LQSNNQKTINAQHNAEHEQFRIRNIIRLGFAAVLGLTFILGLLGLYQFYTLKSNMATIVEVGNEKTALAIKMRDSIRLRALTVQSMLATDDYFRRDQELQNYYAYSGMYRTARTALLAMDMTKEERELHKALQILTRIAQPLNREAAEMLMESPLPKDFETKLEKAVAAQRQLLKLLDEFVDLQKYYAKNLVATADKKFRTTIFMMVVVVTLLLIIGSFIAKRVTRMVTSKNAELAAKNKELEAAWFEAANATHAKSKFLASMSHEIRTPLTSIIGFAETLGDINQDPDDLKHAAESIKRSGNHLYEIINDVLDISKIEAGQIELEMIETSPSAIVNEVTTIMEEKIKKKGLKFRVNYFFPLPKTIITDPTRLRQILLNLLGNAVKFTNEGIVCINTSYQPAERSIKFEVSDTGIGMSKDVQDKVFEPFSQAEKSTTRKFGGTGLGLSISKQLAERMGGGIVCDSKLGYGSAFTATISIGEISDPELIYESAEIDETRNETIASITRNKKYSGRILIAEDTEENQKLLSLHLRKSGIDVEIVSDGRQALNAALQQQFDLIFMDMQMPVMGGLDAIRMLRQRGYNKPIVALTANTSQSDKDACIEAGADGFISKPIDFEKFYGVIDFHLSKRQLKKINTDGQKPLVSDFETQSEYQAILTSFLNNLPGMIDSINKSVRESNWEELLNTAHKVKGLGGSFGYSQLTIIAENICNCVRKNSLDKLDILVHEINQEFRTIMDTTSQHRKAIG